MDRQFLINLMLDCLKALENINYTGYDPADLMNTEIKYLRNLPDPVRRILTLANFYSPINLRSVLKIKQSRNTTAMALLITIYTKMYREEEDQRLLHKAKDCADWLLAKALVDGDSIGWTREIEYQSSRSKKHSSSNTLTFINALAMQAFLDLYEVTGNEKYLKGAIGAGNHLIWITPRIAYPYGTCLSYTDTDIYEILNASVLAGAALNRLSAITGSSEASALSIEILRYTLHSQNDDGSWDYCRKNDKVSKKQYDFHQCYMIEGLSGYSHSIEKQLEAREEGIDRGIHFYLTTLLDSKQYPYWRYPFKFPIDVHNVSHALSMVANHRRRITNSENILSGLYNILIKEFFSPVDNRFSYQKYPPCLVGHRFIRWNDCWSLYALCNLLATIPNKNSSGENQWL